MKNIFLISQKMFFVGLLFHLCTPFSWSQTDECATAPALSVGTSCSTTNWTVASTFTNSAIAYPACAGGNFRDGWFSFVATSTTSYVSCTNNDRTMALAVYSSCSAASLAGCADAVATQGTESLTITTVVGNTYYVRIIRTNNNNNNDMTGTICITSTVSAPTITMTNGSTSSCGATFLDPGGAGNYANNSNFTYTICPTTAGARLKAVFTAFATESGWDYLYIYDGNSTGATLLGTYTGSTSPGTVQASTSNASGCLTFVFTSDGTNVAAGWSADISCILSCQTITANWVSSNKAPDADGIIRLCQGQSVNLVGSGTFSSSGTGATYSWSMGNRVTISGANINYTYPAVGSYLAKLIVTDASGCTNSNALNRNIEISTTPTITTSATPSTLCTNQTSALNANVTMTPYVVNCTPPVSGTTFLPDGSGVSYSTSITTNCYSPGATLTSATDLTNICLNMEHSYSGDLSMTITCPNGQSTGLITYSSGTGSANLGIPWATGTVDLNSSNTTPGTGANYCFSMTGGTAWASAPVTGGTFPNGNGPGTYTDSYIPAGTYTPMQSFASLVGCPLNGNWTIQVTDHLASDNGYIFSWDLTFNSSLFTAASFTPTIVSQGWVAAPTLTSTGATTANVVPVSQGTPCYTYSVTDNFGCTYTSPQCITVNCGSSLPVGLVSFEASATTAETIQLDWVTSSETNSDYFSIERSTDGTSWELIDQVPAMGNSTSTHEYRTFDNHPYYGTSYYRLSQFDLNGSVGTTDMEAVYLDLGDNASLTVFPNPTTGLVSVKGDLISLSTFRFTNNVGQNVKDQVTIYNQATDTLIIDFGNLAPGLYFVTFSGGSVPLVKY